MKNAQCQLGFLTYAMFITICACAMFLYGFFPIKYDDNAIATVADIPNHVGHVRVKSEKLYKPIAKHVVLMVIDAIRWDFVTGPIGFSAMPITNSLMKISPSCLLQVKVNPPTVTMPRIKAMMTGTISSFLDVAFNLGDTPVSGDSVLLQAKKNGHKLNFYGDDVWLKLFPNTFNRYAGTQSFFVNDFTEVDDNVTIHITKELESKEDWSMLILHYLGLDHIGHTAGPFSPLIKQKLIEMDGIISKIHKKIQSWNDKGVESLLIVAGDHGIKDSGGHGGATPEETLVPFLVFGTSCTSNAYKPNLIDQVDVAPILSMILGLPIPSSSVGSIPLEILNDLSDSEKLFVLYYNLQQILPLFRNLPGYESSEAFVYCKEAINKHINWLTNETKNSKVQSILVLYNKALRSIKDLLIPSMIEYDLDTMIAAIIFLIQILYIMESSGIYYKPATMKNTLNWIIGSIFAFFILRFICNFENNLFSFLRLKNLYLTIITLTILVSNSFLCANSTKFTDRFKNIYFIFNFREFIFPLSIIVYILSLTSTSFIEEEHQTWYFFWATFLILVLIYFGIPNDLKFSFKVIFVLVGHRILRKLNSTGNKYAHLPDIANWLKKEENNLAMTVLLIFALALLIWIGYISDDKKHRKKTSIFHSALAICIYLRHTAIGSVAKFPFYFQSRGIIEVRIFWIIILFYSIYWIQRLSEIRSNKFFVNLSLRFIVQLWIIVSAILHKPQNVILLPMQLLFNNVIHDFLRKYKIGEHDEVYIYILMGNVFYYYQGNSNSLATVDVAAGYVGLESYIFIIALIFMTINTFSAPILAYLMLMHHSTLNQEKNSYVERILSINRKYAIWRLLSIIAYTIIITIERFHLFVWSVFSPKLLYEVLNCTVMYIIILSMQLILIVKYKIYK